MTVIAGYLARIGLAREALGPLDASVLGRLVAAHAAAVPFENTRLHRGEPVSVRVEDVLERLVDRREGGICYELNAGLAWLLGELGGVVELVAARVLTAGPDGGIVEGIPMGHMALIVRLPDADWLVDVGFGGDAVLRPAPSDGEQITTARGGAYLVDRRPRALADFEAAAWWHSSNAGSRFMRSVVVSSTRAAGIATLSGSGEGELEWRFRGEHDVEARGVAFDQAQAIALEEFGLRSPLPQRVR